MPRYLHSPESLNSIERNFVPGVGPVPAPVLFCGEAPGPQENKLGRPFVGPAGLELDRYCNAGGLRRDQIYITNLSKYWPPVDFKGKQLPPSPDAIRRDEPVLLEELAIVQPKVVATIGAHASRYFLGEKFKSMRTSHGIPQQTIVAGRELIVIPVFHPAAGLYSMNQEEMARIQWDFMQIGRLLRRQIVPHTIDELPTDERCVYARLYDNDSGPDTLASILAGKTFVAIDTEGSIAHPECLTLCVTPYEAWMVESSETETLAVLDRHLNAQHAVVTVVMHAATHDFPVLEAMGVRVANLPTVNIDGTPTLRDTLSELHNLGGTEPKGLKAAEWRHCNMLAESFEEVAGEAAYRTAREYVERAFSELLCGRCCGTGRQIDKVKVVKYDCPECAGSGRVVGKKPGTTKQCKCVKSSDKCLEIGCTDGLIVPRPAKELVFDQKKGEFRWKQPQSVSTWLKKRLAQRDLTKEDTLDEETAGKEDVEEESSSEEESEASETVEAVDTPNTPDTPDTPDDEEAPAKAFFKLRHDWLKLSQEFRAPIETRLDRMPPISLRAVRDQDRVTRYACRDADATYRLARTLDDRLGALGLQEVATIDAGMLPMLARMERNGMQIDRGHFESFHDDLQKRMSSERERLSDLVGEKNPNSKRTAEVLFKSLGLPALRLTATGQESTDNETLTLIRQQLDSRFDAGEMSEQVVIGREVIDSIQTYRELQKMDGTYVLNILEKADRHDRIHTTIRYDQSVSRLSSENPNLQNIPNPDNSPYKDDPINNFGLRMRLGFVARPGYKLISCDYSQIEMIVGAHLTQDRNLCEAIRNGEDLHYKAASSFLKVPISEVPKSVRTQFKPINFGAFYGLGPQGLKNTLAMMGIQKTEEECAALLNWYYTEFAPDVQRWKTRIKREAIAYGYVKTLYGRLRWMPGLRSSIGRIFSSAQRELGNFPIQGTAGDILRIGMALLWDSTLPSLWAEGIDVQPLMTVHDEIILEAPAEHAELVGWMVGEAMRSAVRLSVPIKVGVGIGDSWATAH